MSGAVLGRLYAGHIEWTASLFAMPLSLALLLRALSATSIDRAGSLAILGGIVHGIPLLAGNTYLPLYLGVALPVSALCWQLAAGLRGPLPRLWVAGLAWLIGFIACVAGKSVAMADLAPHVSRDVDPFAGSQHPYFAIVHLLHPFEGFGFIAPWQRSPWEDSAHGLGDIPGGVQRLAWWEYSYYVGGIVFALALVGPTRQPLNRNLVATYGFAATGVMWLASGYPYSPIHWLYETIPILQTFRVPSRGILLVALIVVAIAPLGADILSARLAARWPRTRHLVHLLMAVSIVELFCFSGWSIRVGTPDFMLNMSRMIIDLKRQDNGPFLVHTTMFGFRYESDVHLALFENGVRIGRYGAPLLPRGASEHNNVDTSTRVRFLLSRRERSPSTLPGAWEPIDIDREHGVVLSRNNLANTDAHWFGRDIKPIRVTGWAVDRFIVDIDEPTEGTLTIPANGYFAGWWATMDGQPIETFVADGFVAVSTAPGPHRYQFWYETPRLGLILGLAALPWILVLGVISGSWCRGLFRFRARSGDA
jgi:hypothetical protein